MAFRFISKMRAGQPQGFLHAYPFRGFPGYKDARFSRTTGR